MSVDSVYGFLGGRYIMPAGSILQIGPSEGANAITIKLLTGGTLEIGGYGTTASIGFTSLVANVTITPSVTAATGQTFGVLYPLSTNEVYSGNFAGKAFLYASGATCVVAVELGRSQGY